jgi:hypothetical protein
MLVWEQRLSTLGSPCAGVRPRTTKSGRLFAISPEVAKLLAVVALGKNILGGSTSLHPGSNVTTLHPDSNVAEAWPTENFAGTLPPSARLRGTGAGL